MGLLLQQNVTSTTQTLDTVEALILKLKDDVARAVPLAERARLAADDAKRAAAEASRLEQENAAQLEAEASTLEAKAAELEAQYEKLVEELANTEARRDALIAATKEGRDEAVSAESIAAKIRAEAEALQEEALDIASTLAGDDSKSPEEIVLEAAATYTQTEAQKAAKAAADAEEIADAAEGGPIKDALLAA